MARSSERRYTPHYTLGRHTGGVSAVAVGELDGRPIVVSGSHDQTVRVWDLATGDPVGGRPPVGEVVFDPVRTHGVENAAQPAVPVDSLHRRFHELGGLVLTSPDIGAVVLMVHIRTDTPPLLTPHQGTHPGHAVAIGMQVVAYS